MMNELARTSARLVKCQPDQNRSMDLGPRCRENNVDSAETISYKEKYKKVANTKKKKRKTLPNNLIVHYLLIPFHRCIVL